MENKRQIESIKNQDCERFFGTIEKVDGKDIILQYKLGGVFYRKHFYTWKKRYSIDLYVVCNWQKRFIYTLASFSNTTHDS